MTDEVRTEQAAAAREIAGRAVEIGGGSSPCPGVAVTVDHRVGRGGVGVEEGKETRPDVCAGMEALPFRDGAFDTLVSVHCLEHHADTTAVLAEWARVAPRLVIVTPDQGRCGDSTVKLDPTHVACFTEDQLSFLVHHAQPTHTILAGPVIMGWSMMVRSLPGGKTGTMKIEVPVTGLSKAKRDKLDGLVSFDPDTNLATFEWRADQNPPHDYATAHDRVAADVGDAGGECGEMRIVG